MIRGGGDFLLRLVAPLLGGLTMVWAFVRSAVDMIAVDYGGTVIGGLWNPSAAAAHPFKVLLGYSSVPLAGERSGRVTLNRAGILAEVERLGAGLVESIEAR